MNVLRKIFTLVLFLAIFACLLDYVGKPDGYFQSLKWRGFEASNSAKLSDEDVELITTLVESDATFDLGHRILSFERSRFNSSEVEVRVAQEPDCSVGDIYRVIKIREWEIQSSGGWVN